MRKVYDNLYSVVTIWFFAMMVNSRHAANSTLRLGLWPRPNKESPIETALVAICYNANQRLIAKK